MSGLKINLKFFTKFAESRHARKVVRSNYGAWDRRTNLDKVYDGRYQHYKYSVIHATQCRWSEIWTQTLNFSWKNCSGTSLVSNNIQYTIVDCEASLLLVFTRTNGGKFYLCQLNAIIFLLKYSINFAAYTLLLLNLSVSYIKWGRVSISVPFTLVR